MLTLAARIAGLASDGKVAAGSGLNILHTAAARVAGLDIGFVPGEGGLDTAGILSAAAGGQLDVLYLLGADEIDTGRLGSTFVIYQGSHGDAGAHRADVILPGAAYTEKSATYVNTEGRAQMTEQAVFPPGEAKEDWKILRALSAEVGQTLPYDTVSALRAEMYKAAPALQRLDQVIGEGDDGRGQAWQAWRSSVGRAVRGGGDGLLPHEPYRASFSGDGRAERAQVIGQQNAGGSRMSVTGPSLGAGQVAAGTL